MTLIDNFSLNKKSLIIYINILVFFTVSFLLLSKRSYQIPLGLLCVFSLLYFFYAIANFKSKSLKSKLLSNDFILIFVSFLLYFVFGIFFFFVHNESITFLDKPSKFIVFSTLLLLLIYYPIRINVLFLSIYLSSIIAGLVAIYQVYYLSEGRAFINTMAIQNGDIAMSLGLFSLFISFYYYSISDKIKFVLGIIASLFGVYASFLSGSRGGWVCLPILLIFFIIYYGKKISGKNIIISFISIFAIFSILFLSTDLSSRFKSAYSDITQYQKGNKATSIGYRFELWKSAVYAWEDKPVLGWGLDNIRDVRIRQEKEKKIIPNLHKTGFHAHNQFLQELSVRGIIGLVVFLILLFVPFIVFYRYCKNRDAKTQILANLGMLHIFLISTYSLTQAFFFHNSGVTFYALMTVLFYSSIYNNLNKHSGNV